MASDLPALAELKTWNTPRVAEFAAGLGLDSDDVKILSDNKFTGASLLNVTKEDLRAAGMPLGPAIVLVTAIAKLSGRGESVSPVGFFKLLANDQSMWPCTYLFLSHALFRLTRSHHTRKASGTSV